MTKFTPKQRTTWVLNYEDFDALVNENILGKPGSDEYNCTAENGWVNDSEHSFGPFEKKVLDEAEAEEYLNFIEKQDYSYNAGLLLQVLVNTDVLPEGAYMIEIYW